MHGIIFQELKKYVDQRVGGDAWRQLLAGSGLGSKVYMPLQQYPDEDLVAIVATASRVTGSPAPELLEDFGRFIAPDLIKLYRHLVDPKWRTLDVIEHTEATIHAAVRLRNPGASPPRLRCTRENPDQVVILYGSERKMCAVARGICLGLAESYGETIELHEDTCMHRGDPECRIVVRRVG